MTTSPERKLHIGGLIRSQGWEVLNTTPGDHVDHLGNANDLSRFPDNTFNSIYASHILEHFDYRDELDATLREWRRVLVAGGKLYISVPDMDILCGLFLDRQLDPLVRFRVMRMMFGGHLDEYDYHVVGLNQEFLDKYLLSNGFVNPQRVQDFGLFEDASSIEIQDVPISLNVIAEKPAA